MTPSTERRFMWALILGGTSVVVSMMTVAIVALKLVGVHL